MVEAPVPSSCDLAQEFPFYLQSAAAQGVECKGWTPGQGSGFEAPQGPWNANPRSAIWGLGHPSQVLLGGSKR